MPVYEKSVDVDVPVRVAYDQWTQFQTFPEFMSGVQRVVQRTDTTMHWVTSIGGVTREFDTMIVEQRPDERIAWRAEKGVAHAGEVTFHRLDGDRTRVHVRMEHEPQGLAERVGAATGAIDHEVHADLDRFKQFIESRGHETGAWRSTVEPPQQEDDGQQIGHTPGRPGE